MKTTSEYEAMRDNVSKYGATVKLSVDESQVQFDTVVYICCRIGHECKTIVGNVYEGCTICNIAKFLGDCIAAQSSYDVTMTSILFRCSIGHVFKATIKNCKRGCRSCYTLNVARKKLNISDPRMLELDTVCINKCEDSRLRWHCNKQRHDPHCTNENCIKLRDSKIGYRYAATCGNFVSCDQDFYWTPRQVRFQIAPHCDDDHRILHYSPIIAILRVFEIHFNDRFDDDTGLVDVTGYNKSNAIAFTHGLDKQADRCLNLALEWCSTNNVRFIYVKKDCTAASKITTQVVSKLDEYGLLTTTVTAAVKIIRDTMHMMDKKHKLYENRCVYV